MFHPFLEMSWSHVLCAVSPPQCTVLRPRVDPWLQGQLIMARNSTLCKPEDNIVSFIEICAIGRVQFVSKILFFWCWHIYRTVPMVSKSRNKQIFADPCQIFERNLNGELTVSSFPLLTWGTVSRDFRPFVWWRYSRKTCVPVVKTSTLTRCQCSQRLRWHDVSVVIKYRY